MTPLYYFGMSAQLKAVIDRFYANDKRLAGGGKRAFLLATAMTPPRRSRRSCPTTGRSSRTTKWQDAGMVLAPGCGKREDIERTDFPQQAFRLGASAAR